MQSPCNGFIFIIFIYIHIYIYNIYIYIYITPIPTRSVGSPSMLPSSSKWKATQACKQTKRSKEKLQARPVAGASTFQRAISRDLSMFASDDVEREHVVFEREENLTDLTDFNSILLCFACALAYMSPK